MRGSFLCCLPGKGEEVRKVEFLRERLLDVQATCPWCRLSVFRLRSFFDSRILVRHAGRLSRCGRRAGVRNRSLRRRRRRRPRCRSGWRIRLGGHLLNVPKKDARNQRRERRHFCVHHALPSES